MLTAVIRPFWQQKHPSPGNQDWDFHWHAPGLTREVRDQIIGLDMQTQAGADSSAWLVADAALIWVRSFRAFVPSEQRHYVGLAGVVATPVERVAPAVWQAHLAALFEMLAPPVAAPFAPGADDRAAHVEVEPLELAELSAGALAELAPDEASREAFVKLVCCGGALTLGRAADERLPELVGQILSWAPSAVNKPRRGYFIAPPGRAFADAPAAPALRRFCHALASACHPSAALARSPGYARRAWRVVLDLARWRGVSVEELFTEIAVTGGAWDTSAGLRRHLLDTGAVTSDEIARCDRAAPAPLFSAGSRDAGWLWNRVLHYWGRSFLGEGAITERLADVLARRVVLDHLFRLDNPDQAERSSRHLGRLLFEALLARRRRDEMARALVRRLPSLELVA